MSFPFLLACFSQGAGRSNCGSSSSSCCRTVPTPAVSHGKGPMGNSRWRTLMKWHGAGENAKASPIWIMTSWAEPSDTTMIRTLWPKCMAKGMPTNLTFMALPRLSSLIPLNRQCTSIHQISPTCLLTMPISRRWTLYLHTLLLCLSHHPVSLELPHLIGPPLQEAFIQTPTSLAIPTPMYHHTWAAITRCFYLRVALISLIGLFLYFWYFYVFWGDP